MIKPGKKFDLESYKKNDLAFKALKENFRYLYPVLREEDYGVDVAVYNGEKAYDKKVTPLVYIELETKYHWEGHNFPPSFKDVQFLAKKQKFSREQIPVYWVLFNRDCSNAAVIPLRKILSCELDVVKCNNPNIGNDYFYRIPLSKMCWGIENIERFIVQDSFYALHNEYRRFIC